MPPSCEAQKERPDPESREDVEPSPVEVCTSPDEADQKADYKRDETGCGDYCDPTRHALRPHLTRDHAWKHRPGEGDAPNRIFELKTPLRSAAGGIAPMVLERTTDAHE